MRSTLKTIFSVACFSLLLVTLIACEKKEAPKPGVAGSLEQLGKEADKAVAQAQTKLNESKEQAAERLSSSLVELDEQFKDLKKKAQTAQGDAKVELDKAMVELEKRSAAANEQLAKLKTAASDKWSMFSTSVGVEISKYKESLDKLSKKYSGGSR